MARGKNSDIFILLCLNALFGLKGRKVPVFFTNIWYQSSRIFLPLSCDILNENTMKNG